MSDINENIEEFNEEDNIVILTDDDGNEVSFEFIDSIEYNGHEYAVLLPTEDEDADGEIVILEVVEEDEDSELINFLSVDDEKVLNAVFEIFKERFKDEFNFED